MYLLHTDDQGRINHLKKTNESIPISVDPSDDHFQQFLTWAKSQFPEWDPNDLPASVVIPFDKCIAIELLREMRRRIAVDFSQSVPEIYKTHVISGPEWLRNLYWISAKDQAPDPKLLAACEGFACSQIRIPAPILSEFEADLPNESSDFRRISAWPITRAFVYLDISDFSQVDALHQAVVIDSLISLVQEDQQWSNGRQDWRAGCEAKLCIGDGYIFVFDDPVNATWFAAHLADLIEVSVAHSTLPIDFHFRMGVHVGEVYCFWDFGRTDWNYIGEAINGGNRVLSAIGKDTDDVVFVSADVRKSIMARRDRDLNHELLKAMDNRGRRKDKHGNPWRVYELNHSDLHGVLKASSERESS